MKAIQYSNILKQSFLLTWKNKFLWFFGFMIFLSLLIEEAVNLVGSLPFGGSVIFDWLRPFVNMDNDSNLLVSILMLAIIIGFMLLRILGIGSLIKSISNLPLYRQIKIHLIVKDASQYYWRLLGVDFVLGLVIFFLFCLLVIPIATLFTLKAYLFGSLTILSALIIFVPLLFLVFFLRKFCNILIVLSGMNVKTAFEFSYSIFRQNIKESLLMGLIILGVGIIFICLIAPIIYIMLSLLSVMQTTAGYIIFAKISLQIIGSLLIFLLFSFLNVLNQAAWLSFFSQISMEKNKKNILVKERMVKSEIPSPETA